MPNIIYLLPTIFWMWMIWECVRYDPEKNTWLWLLIFLNFPGAVIYFFARFLPKINLPVLPVPSFFKRRLRRNELWHAEAAALNIGNAYQFIILGDLRRDLGLLEKAQEAYQQALAKEPENLQALWGMIQIEKKQENLISVKEYLQKLLALKPNYDYGNALLMYIKILIELKEQAKAQNLLKFGINQNYIYCWRKFISKKHK